MALRMEGVPAGERETVRRLGPGEGFFCGCRALWSGFRGRLVGLWRALGLGAWRIRVGCVAAVLRLRVL